MVLSEALFHARDNIEAGEHDSKKIIDGIVDKIKTVDYAIIDYVEVVDAFTLKRIDYIKGTVLIAIAVKVGKPRLIDNLRLEVK